MRKQKKLAQRLECRTFSMIKATYQLMNFLQITELRLCTINWIQKIHNNRRLGGNQGSRLKAQGSRIKAQGSRLSTDYADYTD